MWTYTVQTNYKFNSLNYTMFMGAGISNNSPWLYSILCLKTIKALTGCYSKETVYNKIKEAEKVFWDIRKEYTIALKDYSTILQRILLLAIWFNK